MNLYFGHPEALSKVIGYWILQFSFPNGYTVKVSRNLTFPNSDSWKASLMHKDHEIHDTAIVYDGNYLANGETDPNQTAEEIEAYLAAVQALPFRHH